MTSRSSLIQPKCRRPRTLISRTTFLFPVSLGSVYPNNVKCVWTFYIKPGERAAIGCPTLELDTYSGDCGAGVCSRSVVDTKHRDYLQIVGEVKKDRCVGKSSCNECMTMTKSASSSSSSSCKKEKDNYVTFCGNWSSSKMSKPRADISYEETKGGKIKVVFWSDELRQGKGFFCKYVNLNRPFNSKHVSPRSIGSGVPNPCGKTYLIFYYIYHLSRFQFSNGVKTS